MCNSTTFGALSIFTWSHFLHSAVLLSRSSDDDLEISQRLPDPHRSALFDLHRDSPSAVLQACLATMWSRTTFRALAIFTLVSLPSLPPIGPQSWEVVSKAIRAGS